MEDNRDRENEMEITDGSGTESTGGFGKVILTESLELILFHKKVFTDLEWSSWTVCTASCGSHATQSRWSRCVDSGNMMECIQVLQSIYKSRTNWKGTFCKQLSKF